jgi:N-acyl homoserine lactone hydrolase
MRWLLFLVALSGCAVNVPVVRVRPSTPQSALEVEVCRLDAEIHHRRLWAAIDTLSLTRWDQVIGSFVVKHPRGVLIIDPAFGEEVGTDLRQSPLWFRLVMGDRHGKPPLLGLMTAAGIEPRTVRWVALTHAHWDHAGGLRDLPLTSVWLSQEEWSFVRTLEGHLDRGAIPRQFEIAPGRFAPFAFDEGPRDGFDRSHDLFGDGSVVAFPLPGHTPGSTGYLVQGKGGQRWLFIGDAAWHLEGVKRPITKNAIVTQLVDGDRTQTAQTLGLLHALRESRPDIQIVPAHDLDAMQSIPPCVTGLERPPDG